MTKNNLVVMILGSRADKDWAEKISQNLKDFAITSHIRIASAHKSPEYALQIVREYEKMDKFIVFIAIAGRSNALGGFLDANTHFPVINCPPAADKYAGLDILSSLRMPSGVAPATVLEADQAALLAAKILGLVDEKVTGKIIQYHQELKEKIQSEDKRISRE